VCKSKNIFISFIFVKVEAIFEIYAFINTVFFYTFSMKFVDIDFIHYELFQSYPHLTKTEYPAGSFILIEPAISANGSAKSFSGCCPKALFHNPFR